MPARGRDTGTGRIGRIAASGRSRSSGQPDALLRDRALAAVRQERFQTNAFGAMGETMAAAAMSSGHHPRAYRAGRILGEFDLSPLHRERVQNQQAPLQGFAGSREQLQRL